MYEQVGVREHGGHVNDRKQHNHHHDDDDYDGGFVASRQALPCQCCTHAHG